MQREVVPVFATHKDAGIAVFQLKVMDALEDLREGITLVEVQVAVIRGLRQTPATVVGTDQVFIATGSRPARPYGQG